MGTSNDENTPTNANWRRSREVRKNGISKQKPILSAVTLALVPTKFQRNHKWFGEKWVGLFIDYEKLSRSELETVTHSYGTVLLTQTRAGKRA